LLNKMRVTATIIASPKKMDDVTVGYAYDARAMMADPEAQKAFLTLASSGDAALARETPMGLEVVSKGISARECDANCYGAIVETISNQPNVAGVKVISTASKIGESNPEGSVIGWDANTKFGQK